MQHYIQYHNPDRYGEYKPPKGEFQIMTKKSLGNILGNRIWLVSRKGKPGNYVLCTTFIVDQIGALPNGPLPYFARGFEGKAFAPPVSIGDEFWFRPLLRLTGNFRYGLQHIRDEQVVDGLLRAAHASGSPK